MLQHIQWPHWNGLLGTLGHLKLKISLGMMATCSTNFMDGSHLTAKYIIHIFYRWLCIRGRIKDFCALQGFEVDTNFLFRILNFIEKMSSRLEFDAKIFFRSLNFIETMSSMVEFDAKCFFRILNFIEKMSSRLEFDAKIFFWALNFSEKMSSSLNLMQKNSSVL